MESHSSSQGFRFVRSLTWVSLAACAAGVLIVFLTRSQGPQFKPVAQHKPETVIPSPPSSPLPKPGPASLPGWRSVVVQQLGEIAKGVPDLGTVPPQTALASRPVWGCRIRKIYDGGRLAGYEAYSPASLEDRVYLLPRITDESTGFERLSRILVETVILPHLGQDPDSAARELLDIVTLPEEALGSSADERKVSTALRWMAASALRGLVPEDLRSRVEEVARSAPDEVLRGALTGSLIAFKDSDEFIRGWLGKESSDWALQAFLSELACTRYREDFTHDMQVRVLKDTRDHFNYVSDKQGLVTRSPESGQAIGSALVDLLRRLPTLPFPKSEGTADADESGIRWEQTETGKRLVYDPVRDARSLAADVLYGRLGPEDVRSLEGVLREEPSVRRRASMVWALGAVEGAESERLLTLYCTTGGDEAVRYCAARGLVRRGTERTTRIVEQLLWTEDEGARVTAALAIEEGRPVVSEAARARLRELAASAKHRWDQSLFGRAATLAR